MKKISDGAESQKLSSFRESRSSFSESLLDHHGSCFKVLVQLLQE